MIAQYVAYAHAHTVFAGQAGDLQTLAQTLRDGFFEQHVVTRANRLDGRIVVCVVGRGNQHGIGTARCGEEVVVMRIAIFFVEAEAAGETSATQFVGLDDGSELQPLGVATRVFEVFRSPVSGADHGEKDRT